MFIQDKLCYEPFIALGDFTDWDLACGFGSASYNDSTMILVLRRKRHQINNESIALLHLHMYSAELKGLWRFDPADQDKRAEIYKAITDAMLFTPTFFLPGMFEKDVSCITPLFIDASTGKYDGVPTLRYIKLFSNDPRARITQEEYDEYTYWDWGKDPIDSIQAKELVEMQFNKETLELELNAFKYAFNQQEKMMSDPDLPFYEMKDLVRLYLKDF